jgi:predicted transcriptional regulator
MEPVSPEEPQEPAGPLEPLEPLEPPKVDPAASIEVKTKFPVARIKRIMQADEDVGKVAQVTPIAVCTYLTTPIS